MITLRELMPPDIKEMTELKASCFKEETKGLSSDSPNIDAETEQYIRWLAEAEACHDFRIFMGAFEDGKLVGAAIGSLAEKSDALNAMELNGLWVYSHKRGRGVSLMLVIELLERFKDEGVKDFIAYSFHDAPSNAYYRKFGCRVLRSEKQLKEKLKVDVFECDIDELHTRMRESLSKYIEE